jgi:hypothetical protein
MPVRLGQDKTGRFAQWGFSHTARYYYRAGDKASRERAKALALRQGMAIKASQHYRGGRKE